MFLYRKTWWWLVGVDWKRQARKCENGEWSREMHFESEGVDQGVIDLFVKKKFLIPLICSWGSLYIYSISCFCKYKLFL